LQEEGRASLRHEAMRLQPYQIAVLGLGLFWAGLVLALILVQGHTQPADYPPFHAPF